MAKKNTEIPKIIHLCWFSGQSFPVEIKWCLESWGRLLPDYEIRLWTARDARAIGYQYIDQALDAGKWAFAADAVRFYAVMTEGGWYMDADILLLNPIPDIFPDSSFLGFNETMPSGIKMQAAIFAGKPGNEFCRRMATHYETVPFITRDGRQNLVQATTLMTDLATLMGWEPWEQVQTVAGDTTILPGLYVTPAPKGVERRHEAFARHIVYGSWQPRKFFPKMQRAVKHFFAWVRYQLVHLSHPAKLPPLGK